jgi:ribosomal protein L34E
MSEHNSHISPSLLLLALSLIGGSACSTGGLESEKLSEKLVDKVVEGAKEKAPEVASHLAEQALKAQQEKEKAKTSDSNLPKITTTPGNSTEDIIKSHNQPSIGEAARMLKNIPTEPNREIRKIMEAAKRARRKRSIVTP